MRAREKILREFVSWLVANDKVEFPEYLQYDNVTVNTVEDQGFLHVEEFLSEEYDR